MHSDPGMQRGVERCSSTMLERADWLHGTVHKQGLASCHHAPRCYISTSSFWWDVTGSLAGIGVLPGPPQSGCSS